MKYKSFNENADLVFEKYKNNVAIDYKNQEITYGMLKADLIKFVHEIENLGYQKKGKALVAISDPITYVKVLYSLWTLDYIVIPFQGKVCTREIEEAIKASDCDFIVENYGFHDDVRIDETDVATSKVSIGVTYHKLKSNNDFKDNNDTAIYFYTSGTTGLPKCVAFSADALWKNVFDLVEEWELSNTDVLFTPLSPLLTATLTTAVLPILMVGGKLVLTNTALPGNIIKTIRDKNVTVFFAVPYIYDLVNGSVSNKSRDDWQNVRICATSSARLNEKTYQKFYSETGKIMHSIYCSSEAGAITYNDSKSFEGGFPSVGRCFSGVEIRILSKDGALLKAGECGEIYVKGSHISSGYHNRPELEKEVFKDGLVKTSDIGYLDDNGYLYITGRDSATINVSGHLVNPEEIEKLLIENPKIKDCVVYGNKSEGIGEEVAVKIVMENASETFSVDDVFKILDGKISSYKIPRKVKVVDELEYGRYGKKIRR